MTSYISLYYKVSITGNVCRIVLNKLLVGDNLIGSYKDIMHETHTIIFTNSRKRASSFTPGVFQGVDFKVFISVAHYFGIIIKEKYSPFKQGMIQQPIMSSNKVITPMTELPDPPSYIGTSIYFSTKLNLNTFIFQCNHITLIQNL